MEMASCCKETKISLLLASGKVSASGCPFHLALHLAFNAQPE